MNEIDIIARAQMYLEKLANGIDPLTGSEVREDDIVNNVRISRCLFYTSGLLKQIIENGGKLKIEIPERPEFSLTGEQRNKFRYSQIPIPISDITKRFNELIDASKCKPLKLGVLTDWLISAGMLHNVTRNDVSRKYPTEQGRRIGIMTEQRTSMKGIPYETVLYDTNAQRFLVDNIDGALELDRRVREVKNADEQSDLPESE